MDKQLEIMGATRIYERGEGDDDQNIEEDFEQWQENGLWPAILKALGKGDCQGKEDPEMRNGRVFAHLTRCLDVHARASLHKFRGNSEHSRRHPRVGLHGLTSVFTLDPMSTYVYSRLSAHFFGGLTFQIQIENFWSHFYGRLTSCRR